MRTHVAVLAALLLLGAPGAGVAQGTAKDTIVEIIGLESWTVPQVEAALQRLRPGISLADAACAVLLRDSLGFAQAAVHTWSFPDTVWTTLTVVEPGKSARVRLRPPLSDSLPDRREWLSTIAMVRENARLVHPLQRYEFLRGRTDSVFGRRADPAVLEFRDRIEQLARAADYEQLVWTVERDGNLYNRLLATLLLGHFPERDRSWWTLVHALRGPSDFAGTAARMVLEDMARQGEYRVDWRSAELDLRYLLGGANPFAFLPVLNVLGYTDLDHELARRLIPHGRELIVGNLRSKNPRRQLQVRAFLSRVTVEEFGDDSAAWIQWLESVRESTSPDEEAS